MKSIFVLSQISSISTTKSSSPIPSAVSQQSSDSTAALSFLLSPEPFYGYLSSKKGITSIWLWHSSATWCHLLQINEGFSNYNIWGKTPGWVKTFPVKIHNVLIFTWSKCVCKSLYPGNSQHLGGGFCSIGAFTLWYRNDGKRTKNKKEGGYWPTNCHNQNLLFLTSIPLIIQSLGHDLPV